MEATVNTTNEGVTEIADEIQFDNDDGKLDEPVENELQTMKADASMKVEPSSHFTEIPATGVYGSGGGDESSQRNRRVHPVWEHFTVTADNSMKCLLCGRVFKTTSSTTVCKHHLRSRHPDVASQLEIDAGRDWRTKTDATIGDGQFSSSSANTTPTTSTTQKDKPAKKRPKQSVAPLVASATTELSPSLFDYNHVLKHIKSEAAGSSNSFGFIANLLCQPPLSSSSLITRPDVNPSGVDATWGGLKADLDVDETKDESSPLGCLVVDLHRKLRETKKTHKALEFKRGLFNLISEFETELL